MSSIKVRRTGFSFDPEAIIRVFRGITQEEDGMWRKLWNRLLGIEPGKLVSFNATVPRNGKFHAKLFALLQVGFDAWEPDAVRTKRRWKGRTIEKNADQFRSDIIILAGYYVVSYAVDGSLVLTAQSISYAEMDDLVFEKLYSAVIDVLLAKIMTNRTREDVDAQVNRILDFA